MVTTRTSASKSQTPTPTKKGAALADEPNPSATEPERRFAKPHEILLSSTTQNVIAMHAWGQYAGKGDLSELIRGFNEKVEKVQAGDMRPVESMLYGQAMTLQTMFTSLTRAAASETGLKQYQAKLTFALKAQAQCRATLEALAEIKNPRPVSFVKQANISNGPQQVNNGTPGNSAQYAHAGHNAHAGENAGQQNELLEHQHGNYLDTGAQGQAGGADSHLEAVEAGQRATHA